MAVGCLALLELWGSAWWYRVQKGLIKWTLWAVVLLVPGGLLALPLLLAHRRRNRVRSEAPRSLHPSAVLSASAPARRLCG